jgi:hypothetical protein
LLASPYLFDDPNPNAYDFDLSFKLYYPGPGISRSGSIFDRCAVPNDPLSVALPFFELYLSKQLAIL